MIRRFVPLLAAVVFMAMPASALAVAGGATRTWVSGTGDDANPCSRTAPCKTLAGALSKTNNGGEIDAIDPAGYGTVTIVNPVTISGVGTDAAILASGTNAVNIIVPAGQTVVLNDLHLNGQGTGLGGVSITGSGHVLIENSEIFGFADNGISFTPSAGGSLEVINSVIHDNAQDGLLTTAPSSGSDSVTLENDSFDGNGCGVAVGPGTAAFGTTTCGTAASGNTRPVAVNASGVTMSQNIGTGLLVNGSGAQAEIAGSTLTANATGLATLNGGQIVEIGVGNAVFGNGANGAPTATQSAQLITGPAGPAGPAGPQGPAGANGKPGPAGQVELVTCAMTTKARHVAGKTRRVKVQTCTAKLVSSTVKFRTARATAAATLSRAGRIYATGRIAVGAQNVLGELIPRRAIPAGRYVLTVKRGGRVIRRQLVSVR